MFYLTNREANLKFGFDFLNDLPDDFDIAKSKSEKWVPFVMNIATPEKTIAITEKMKACMTVYEKYCCRTWRGNDLWLNCTVGH
ncbi:MAG: hypothetical protein NC417_08445 [Candidatus Gastranaerophilales bacterium]|nr:hypothetical protein [Candidatus Gastranaerophilales bacterium]